jgi:UDP-glucose 4-epimerase
VARVPWEEPHGARKAIADHLGSFLLGDEPASVLWCAGAGVVGTAEEQLRHERELLDVTLTAIERAQRGPIRFFLASSAGGVYGGNSGLCTEATTPLPVSDYGRSKLLQERMVADWATAIEVDVLVGRISNLFGPRQNMTKPQGFVSHLLAAMAIQRPLVFTVPGSTIRDFVYAEDVGGRVAAWVRSPLVSTRVSTKILAAERSVTLANLTCMAARVARRSPRVLFSRASGPDQPAVIRFKSVRSIEPELDWAQPRSLEHALWLTWSSLMRRRVSTR